MTKPGIHTVLAMLFTCAGAATCVYSEPQAPSAQPNSPATLPIPAPLEEGAKVVTLWPPGSSALKALEGSDKPEQFKLTRDGRVASITNIHNPSLEVHLAPPDKANGMAIIVAAGGGNMTLNVGGEGTDIATWLNGLGVSAFIERYRLRPYDSATDALADTERSVRMIRANASAWNVDPNRIGIMGFSAGGEQAARAALNFDSGNPSASDAVERQSSRPDFVVLVYAGWKKLDLTHVPKNAPPAFLTCAGVDDAFHARETVEFYDAYFNAKIPVELHIYGHGGHANGIKPRNGIPFGTWQNRFIDWVTDLGMMKST